MYVVYVTSRGLFGGLCHITCWAAFRTREQAAHYVRTTLAAHHKSGRIGIWGPEGRVTKHTESVEMRRSIVWHCIRRHIHRLPDAYCDGLRAATSIGRALGY